MVTCRGYHTSLQARNQDLIPAQFDGETKEVKDKWEIVKEEDMGEIFCEREQQDLKVREVGEY